MGLDMYLYVDVYVGGKWNGKGGEFTIGSNTFLANEVNSIKLETGYWRKDNHIHNWFVKHCAEGVDDCKPMYVQDSDLDTLRRLCSEVIADPTKAEELLPCAGGFFFGSVEYDEYYIESLQSTIDIIDKTAKMVTRYMGDIIYQASW